MEGIFSSRGINLASGDGFSGIIDMLADARDTMGEQIQRSTEVRYQRILSVFPDSKICSPQQIHQELTVSGSVYFGFLAAFCKHPCLSGISSFGEHIISFDITSYP